MKEKSDPPPEKETSTSRASLTARLTESLAGPIPVGTERRLMGRLTFPNKATTLIGMQRAGKTTFLHQLRRQRLERGISQERLPYINLEDERLAGFTLKDFSTLVEEYYRRFPSFRGRETVTWCFDEIQVTPGWERFVRRLLDTEKVEVFLTGSSASFLSREIATSMRGRAWEVRLFPFSFEEFLHHHGLQVPEPPFLLSTKEKTRLQGALLQYLEVGGFPEAQRLQPADRFQLLADYVDVAILRDVIERHEVANVTSLRWMVRRLLGSPGGHFSVEKFHRTLKSQGLAVSRDTLHGFLRYLEDCFLVRLTWVEADSERRRMVNPRKVHPVDPGLIPVYDRSGKANLGHALESVVRVELERRRAEIHYVKTREGYEVDMLARWPKGREELIQVAADLTDPETLEREVRALQAAGKEHPRAKKTLVTLTPEAAAPLPEDVHLQDAAFWLLPPGEE